MTTAYTSLLGLALPVTGELSGTWGDTVNNSITSLLDSAVAGTTTLSSDADVTLTTTTGASNTSRQAILLWTAGGTVARNITAPAQSKIYTVINASSSTQSIVLRGVGPTAGVTIVKGESAVCAWNGSDFIKISNTSGAGAFTSITLTGTAATNTTALTAQGTTTGFNRGRIFNTGGDLRFGIDSSVGSEAVAGSAAYSSFIGSFTNTPFYLVSNSAIVGTVSSTGLAVTGALSTTGNITNSNAAGRLDFTGGSSAQVWATASSLYLDASAGQSVIIRPNNQVTAGTFSSTGLAVTGSLDLLSAVNGNIAKFKSSSNYGTVVADNSTSTGGGVFSVWKNGTQVGAFAVDGAIQGNTSSDVAIYAETGGALKFYTNGSATSKASISTAGLFTVTAGASIQGLTVGLGNASASATSTAVGISALASSTGTDATAFGYFAGENLSSGAFSIAIGSRAMGGTTGGPNTGSYNTAIGNSSLTQNTSGNRNIAIGNEAMTANQGGSYNVAIGSYQASGGDAVMGVNTAGNGNTAVGAGALPRNTVSFNTAVGYTAGFNTSSGGPNTHIGAYAGYYCTTGTNNVSLGYGANGFNIATGFMTGSFNTALGDAALYAISSGGVNTATGYLAGAALTSGTGGTFYGKSAGSNLTTGDYGTYVGFGSQASSTGASYEMVVCTTNTSAVGKGASTGFISAGGAGGIYNGANTTTWATTSDRRLKKNIVGNNTGLDKITSIQVRNFEYRLPEEVDAELKPTDAIKKSGVQLGVIAQELQQVLPECVKSESTGVMSVDTDNLTWYMINAIKELKAEVDSLKSQLNGA